MRFTIRPPAFISYIISVTQFGYKALALVAALGLLSLMILTGIDVFERYVFNHSLPGSAELTELILAVVVFACLPAATARQEHVVTDAIEPWLSERGRKIQIPICHLAAVIALGCIGWRIWIVAENLSSYKDSSSFLKIPLAPFAYFMGATAIFSAVISASLFIGSILGWTQPSQTKEGADSAQQLVG